MTTRAVAEIDDWESEPFSGGYAGLHDLADEGVSGVVQSGAAKLCLLNGTVVGILDGTIEDFEDASGTVYRAPSPALPLLAFMQEHSDEVRAKYYTEETPISDVDGTLSDGGFSGYVELSENVLSGDYYVVYHAGRSMAVAWVGNSGQLLTDDEAFERSNDEVGIYEVRPVDVEPIEIPEPAGAAGGVTASDSDGSTQTTNDPDAKAGDPPSEGVDTETEPDESTDAPTEVTEQSAPGGTAEAPSGTAEPPGGTAEAPDGSARTTDGSATAEASGTGSTAETGGSSTESAASTSDDVGTAEPAERTTADDASASAPERERERASSGGVTTDGESETGDDTETSRSSVATDAADSDDAAASSGRRRRTDDSPAGDSSTGASESSTGASETRSAERDAHSADDGRTRTTDQDRSTGETRAATSRQQSSSGAAADATSDTTAGTDASASTDRATRETEGDAAQPSNRSPSRDRRGADDAGGRVTGTPGADVDDDAAPGRSEVGAPEKLETRSIPSLDPARTSNERTGDGRSSGSNAGSSSGRDQNSGRSTGQSDAETETRPEPARARDDRSGSTDARASGRDASGGERGSGVESGRRTSSSAEAESGRPDDRSRRTSGGSAGGSQSSARGGSDQRVSDLEAELEATEAELERVEAELTEAETDRDDLRAELDDLRAERDDLRAERDALADERDRLEAERDDREAELEAAKSECDELRTELRTFKEEHDMATDAERRLSPGEALQQTNLFVRYETKGQATLESAHDGNATREEVNGNLGLEHHTQFEANNVSVAGNPFSEFLRQRIEHQFVTWVIHDLIYEVRDTGKVPALQELYDAIPRIDRAQLKGTVTVEFTEDGQERRAQESFDVVLRDRMGNPLMVANLNDSRQAATESMMSSLVSASSRVGESEDSLAASFLVTRSFFEPEALETASEATSGGLLSRDKRESFVKLSRKRGYHLCLAEAREGKFHLTVPDL